MSQIEGVTAADFVTGEAVALEIPSAGLGARFLGILIDAIVQIIVLILLLVSAATMFRDVDDALGEALITAIIAFTFLGLPVGVEVLTNGKSLGKLATGTRVVRTDHGALTARHSLVRGVIGLVEIWLTAGALAGSTAFLSRRTQRIGDLAAGTIVVRERVKLVTPIPLVTIPYLQEWVRRSDVGDIPPALTVAARQFLGRRLQLSPFARARMGVELAGQLARYVSPLPPPGTHPEDVIAAVVTERGRRDLERWGTNARRWSTMQQAAARR